MKIVPKSLFDVQSQPARAISDSSRNVRLGGALVSRPTLAIPRNVVELAPEGRALGCASALTADRVHQIRLRILAGAYDSMDVIDTVARQILQRGDV